jgi:hypothetical protein
MHAIAGEHWLAAGYAIILHGYCPVRLRPGTVWKSSLIKKIGRTSLASLALLGCVAAGAAAQVVPAGDTATAAVPVEERESAAPEIRFEVPTPFRLVGTVSLLTIGSAEEERVRMERLLGTAPGRVSLIRSPSSRTPRLRSDAVLTAAPITPEVVSVWNSALPFSFNEGELWAGRGLNVGVIAGLRADVGPLSVIFAPRLLYQANREFQVIPFDQTRDPSRDRFSSPWHYRPASMDLPSRHGAASRLAVSLGQSSVTAVAGPMAIGVASENLWWGPGIRNAIVMSNHAPGVPHFFLRTDRPLSIGVGELEGRWILGRLAESRFYDAEPSNDGRSLSALALAFRPSLEPNLTLGFTRAVYAPASARGVVARAALDVFHSVGRPNARQDSLIVPGADQLFSLFSHWIFPTVGFEAYAEWARYEEPAGLRDFLEMPHHSQGYTLGVQWARALPAGALRIQAEATSLEPSASYRHRPVISWYASRAVEQGYTHEGQVIGASIGPGASSQWLAADLFRETGVHFGLFGGRIRWDNAIFYEPTPRPFFAHDVSVFVGARGGWAIGSMLLSAELATEARLNYLFQNQGAMLDSEGAVDIRNHSLRLQLSPRAVRR